MADPACDPVIIGIGEFNDRPAELSAAMSTPRLIAAAIRLAAQDAGLTDIGQVDWLAIVDALSRDDRPAPLHPQIAGLLGLAPRHATSSPSPSGNYPIRFLEDAANAIAAGEAEIAVIAGGEAMRSFTRARQTGANGTQVIRDYRVDRDGDLLQRHGLSTPVDIYPLYEQATRHAWGQSLAEAQAESSRIWAGNAAVAAANPHAWIRDARGADEIITPAPANPMMAFPYTRAMVANSSVNQAAALIVTSVGRARSLGISDARMVHVGYGAAADEAPGNLDRANFVHSPAMEAALRGALSFNAVTTGDLDHVELYSCFPCVPKMARRILDWPLDKPHSIYGGLTFGGGPIGNCMTHAAAALVRRIRSGSRNGLIFANGGFATRNHAIVLTRDPIPGGRGVHSYDLQRNADAARGQVPRLIADYTGNGTIESFTIPFSAGTPQYATVVARATTGDRFLARVPGADSAMLAWLMSDTSTIGTEGRAVDGDSGLTEWRSPA